MEVAKVRSNPSRESSEQKLKDSKLSFFTKAPVKPEESGHSRVHGEGSDAPLPLHERRLLPAGTEPFHQIVTSLCCTTLFQRMRQQQLFEITGMDGNDYTFTLSGIGREQAAKRFLICHYIGPAPVSFRHTPRPSAARTSGS